MTPTFQIVLTLVSIVFSLSMILINTIKGRGNKKANRFLKWYSIYFSVAVLWLLGELILSASSVKVEWFAGGTENSRIYLFTLYKYATIFFITPLFALYIFGYMAETLGISKKKQILFMTAMLLVFIPASIIFITNSGQKIAVYTSEGITTGILFNILMLVLYAFLLLIILMIIVFMLKKYSWYKKQIFFIIVVLFISYAVTCLNFQLGLNRQFLRLDIAPAIFLPPVLLVNYYAMKYTLLCITPVAFPKMTDDLREAILVIDKRGDIAYLNQSLKKMFTQCSCLNLDNRINPFCDYLKSSAEMDNGADDIIDSVQNGVQEALMGEIRLKDVKSTYSVSIKPLELKNVFSGWVVAFYDITEYKNLLAEVKQNNDRLSELNGQLKDYAEKVGELAAVRERNKLASEVHDSIGHTMAVIISLIGVCSILCDKDVNEAKQKLGQMMEIAMKGHDELRHSVLGIVPRRNEEEGVVKKIEALVREFGKAGIKVEFEVDGHESPGTDRYGSMLGRICKEALTNSLKHGKATQVNIILRLSEKKLTLFIFDDGIGCKEISKNMGLTGMENRIREVNGTISYGSDGEKGFNINIEIPVTND